MDMKWIPVTDRLPANDGVYLCTCAWNDETWRVDTLEYGNVTDFWKENSEPDRVFGEKGFGELWHDGVDNVEHVSAWMPLPEIYRESAVYRYYSTERPAGPGTCPKEGLKEIIDFPVKAHVPNGLMAWSCLLYDRKLPDKETADYELAYCSEEDFQKFQEEIELEPIE